MSRRQENSSRPVSLVSEKSLKLHMDESQPPPPPVRHRKRRAPKPPVQNAGMSSDSKKSSEFIAPAPPSGPAPIPVARRKSTPADDEDEYEEEDVMVGNVGSRCKTKADSGGATTGGTLISHSRNSSDSSGYHEASVLSESPESGLGGSGAPDTLPRRKQQNQLQQQRSAATAPAQLPPFSRSMGNLASAGPPSSVSTTSSKTMMSSSSYSSLSASTSSLPSQKKKKAPAPPPPLASAPPGKQEMTEVVNKQDTSTSRNMVAPSSNSLDNMSQVMNGKKDQTASLERNFVHQPKDIGNVVSEPLKSDSLPVQPLILNESPLDTKVPNSQILQRNHVDTSSEKSASCPVGSASKPASGNKSGPAVAPKPHPKVNISGANQRPVFQNGQGSQDAIPIPLPRSKPPMPKKRIAPNPTPRSSIVSDTESEPKICTQGQKEKEVPAKRGLLSGFSALSMVPALEDSSEDLTDSSVRGMDNLHSGNEDDLVGDDLDLELFDGGKVDSLESDGELNEEEKSSEEEFDENVIRKVLVEHELRSFADVLDSRIEDSILKDVEGDVISKSQDDDVEGFCFKEGKQLVSETEGGCSEIIAGPRKRGGFASTKTRSSNSSLAKVNGPIRQVESAINFSNLGRGCPGEMNDSSRFSSNSLCSEVDMPFTNGGGAAKMNRWPDMESLIQSSSTSSMEKHVKEMVAYQDKALAEDDSISATWVVGSESDNDVHDISEVASTADTADSMTADSIDEVDNARQLIEATQIGDSEETIKPLDFSEPVQELVLDHSGKMNGVCVSPTLLPSPPPSLEFMGQDAGETFGTEGRVGGGVEVEELEWEYKLPAPPTGFQDEEERRDGAEEAPKKKQDVVERETWVAESETASIPSTFSSAASHRKMWTVDIDAQPVQHLPNFRMSTYRVASEDGWENPREELGRGNQRVVEEDGLGKSKGRTFVMLNSDSERKVDKELKEPNKNSFETWASVSSKSSFDKAHYSNLDLSHPSPHNNSGAVMTCFQESVGHGIEANGSMKNGSYVVRVSSFGGKSSTALKRSLSSTSSLVSRHSSNDGRDIVDKLNKEVGVNVTQSIAAQTSHRNGIGSHSLSNSSRTVSLHDLAISSIREESRIGESFSDEYHKENTTPKIVSSKWKKPQAVNGGLSGRCGSHDTHNLRKTSSELSINQAGYTNGWKEKEDDEQMTLLQQQFLQWHEQLLQNKSVLEGNVQVPLKSLQVLRGVLPHLKKSLESDLAEKDATDKLHQKGRENKMGEIGFDGTETSKNNVEAFDSLPASTESNAVLSSNHVDSSSESTTQEAVEEIPKRYSYAGPPAINFGTWSERPKSEVSLKRDSDYRIGVGQAPRIKETYSQLNSSVAVRPCKSTPSNQSSNSQTDNPPCPPPKPAANNRVIVNIVSATKHEPVSRLPIVRSVELKKTAPAALTRTTQTGPRPINGKFPSDLREELTGALASLVDANRSTEMKAMEEVNERRKRQQIPCSSALPPPPPDVITVARHSMPAQATNLRRMGSTAGLEGGVRVNGFGGLEKRQGVLPFAPVVKGFRLNAIATQTAAAPQAPPPPPAVVCGVALKKRVEPSSTAKMAENPRDQLLLAIREFGGRENLKRTTIHYK